MANREEVLSLLEKEKKSLLNEYRELEKKIKGLLIFYFQCAVSLMMLNGGATFYQGAFPMCYGAYWLSLYMSIAFLPGFWFVTCIMFGRWRELNILVEDFKDMEESFVEDLENFCDGSTDGRPADRGTEPDTAVGSVQRGGVNNDEASSNEENPTHNTLHQVPDQEEQKAVPDQEAQNPIQPNSPTDPDQEAQNRRYNRRVRCLRRVPWNSDKFGWFGRYSFLMYWIVIVGIGQTFALPYVIHHFLCHSRLVTEVVISIYALGGIRGGQCFNSSETG